MVVLSLPVSGYCFYCTKAIGFVLSMTHKPKGIESVFEGFHDKTQYTPFLKS